MGEACRVAREDMPAESERIRMLAQKLHKGVDARIPDVILNGDPVHRYPGNLNLSFSYVEGESLLMAIKDLAVSSGSACTSASLGVARAVLRAARARC
jgi:cysteine desulfurase